MMRIRERERTDEAKNKSDDERYCAGGRGVAGDGIAGAKPVPQHQAQRRHPPAGYWRRHRARLRPPPRRSRPAQPGRDRPAGELHAELRPVYRRHQPGAGSGVAQRDPAHRLRLRRRHRAGAEHHPPAGEAQLHRDCPRLPGHHAGGDDGIPGLHPHPAGAA